MTESAPMPLPLNYAPRPSAQLGKWQRRIVCAALLVGVFLFWIGFLWVLSVALAPG